MSERRTFVQAREQARQRLSEIRKEKGFLDAVVDELRIQFYEAMGRALAIKESYQGEGSCDAGIHFNTQTMDPEDKARFHEAKKAHFATLRNIGKELQDLKAEEHRMLETAKF